MVLRVNHLLILLAVRIWPGSLSPRLVRRDRWACGRERSGKRRG